jgi:hypothetical protein
MENRWNERMPLLNPQRMEASKRWLVLASFCLFSFTNALQWISFSPAVQTFAKYFFNEVSLSTTNAINAFSGSYMIIYPILVPFSFSYFEDEDGSKLGSGLKRGITIGALLNAIAGVIRWLGAYPSWQGYSIVFLGQVIAAIGMSYCTMAKNNEVKSANQNTRISSFFFFFFFSLRHHSTSVHARTATKIGCRMVSSRRNQLYYCYCGIF